MLACSRTLGHKRGCPDLDWDESPSDDQGPRKPELFRGNWIPRDVKHYRIGPEWSLWGRWVLISVTN